MNRFRRASRPIILLLIVLTAGLAVSPAIAQDPTPEGGDPPTSTDSSAAAMGAVPEGMVERLLTFDPAASEEHVQAMLGALGATELGRIPEIGVIKALVPAQAAERPDAAIQGVQSANPAAAAAGLFAIEPNALRYADYTVTDPQFGSQWALTDVDAGIWVSYAWDLAPTRGTGVTVAVIDTGVDLQHPEFLYQTVPGWDFYNDDNNPDDDHGHGTHVAGIIAAKANNGQGTAGVAFNAKIMPIKALGFDGYGFTYDIASAIVYAADKGAHVINMSLGSCGAVSTTEAGAVAYALARNVTVVAAAGNGLPGCNPATQYSYPASYPGVISVANHTETGVAQGLSEAANHNDRVTISAPGTNILSTLPLPTGYGYASGTSMASPHVAGVAALIYGANVARTPAGIKEALICGAVEHPTEDLMPGRDDYYGWGMLQADLSLNWNENSSSCKVVAPNDRFQTATALVSPATKMQAVDIRSVSSTPDENFLQSVWYSFKPTLSGFYQLNTFGSDFDTIIQVYTGNQGELATIPPDVNTMDAAGTTQSQGVWGLTAGIQYYIEVGSAGGAVNNGVLRIDLRQAFTTINADVQSNTPNFDYSGSWNLVSRVGANLGSVQETYDNNARATFAYRGEDFRYYRTVGPDRGRTLIYVDGVLEDTIDNRAAVTKANQFVLIDVASNGPHTVVIQRDVSGPTGPIDVDAIRVVDTRYTAAPPVVTTQVDDRATSIIYTGTWNNIAVTGAYLNTVKETSTSGDKASFYATGNTITIFRTLDPSYGAMEVWVDGVLVETESNIGGPAKTVPYVVDNLAPTQHYVEIVNASAAYLQLDSVKAATVTPILAGTLPTDERAPSIMYSGYWTRTANTLAQAGTLTATSDLNAFASFFFSGNKLCIGYKREPGAGTVDLYIDGALFEIIDTSGVEGYKVQYCTDDNNIMLADTTHFVELNVVSGPVTLDYIKAMRYNTITPARGLVAETDLSFIYAPSTPGTWNTWVGARSPGYFYANGSAVKWTITNGASVSFYINGTGFILYTATYDWEGEWRVIVDGAPMDVYFEGALVPTFDLDNNWRWVPTAVGVTDLDPGIHHIQLEAVLGASEGIDFDGVRVFP